MILERLETYVQKNKPSPYLLEYLAFLCYLFLLIVGFGLLSILLGLTLVRVDGYFLGVSLLFLIFTIAALLHYFLIADRAGWLYWLDKRKGQVEVVQGEIWDIHFEKTYDYTYDFDETPNKVHYFYDDELCASRMLLYCLQPGEDVFPRGKFDTGTRTLETKNGRKLKYVRTVFTVPKVEVFERFMEICPDMKAELVYWKWSKVLIEFRPMEGVEYPPEALECLKAMNAMYP